MVRDDYDVTGKCFISSKNEQICTISPFNLYYLTKDMQMVRKTTILFLFTLFWNFVSAQAPDIIPYGESDKIEFTPTNIIVYIVLPVLIVIGYLYYRKKQREKERNERNRNS